MWSQTGGPPDARRQFARRASPLQARSRPVAGRTCGQGQSSTRAGCSGHRLREAGPLRPMSRITSSHDNAPMNSFWPSMQHELSDRRSRPSKQVLAPVILEWIEGPNTPARTSHADTTPAKGRPHPQVQNLPHRHCHGDTIQPTPTIRKTRQGSVRLYRLVLPRSCWLPIFHRRVVFDTSDCPLHLSASGGMTSILNQAVHRSQRPVYDPSVRGWRSVCRMTEIG